MPTARSRAAAAWSTAEARLASTTTGLGVSAAQSLHGQREGLVAVVLRDQVDGERDHVDPRVRRQRGETLGEQVRRVAAAAPHVQRVGRHQPLVELGGQPVPGRLAEWRERHAHPLGEVGDQRPLRPGVVDGRDARAGSADQPPADGEELEGVHELGQVGHAVDAVRREQRLPPSVGAGERARVGLDHRAAHGRRPDRQGDHRDVPLGRLRQRRRQAGKVAHRLEDQPDDAGLGRAERVGEVVGGGGDQLPARRDDRGEAEGAVRAQQRREDRAAVGHQGDGAGRQRVSLEVAERAHPGRHVDEPHAPAADDLQVAGGRRQLAVQTVRRAEHHGAGVPPGSGQPHLVDQGGVGDTEQHQVHLAPARRRATAGTGGPRRWRGPG